VLLTLLTQGPAPPASSWQAPAVYGTVPGSRRATLPPTIHFPSLE
jgi:hypothetical protein